MRLCYVLCTSSTEIEKIIHSGRRFYTDFKADNLGFSSRQDAYFNSWIIQIKIKYSFYAKPGTHSTAEVLSHTQVWLSTFIAYLNRLSGCHRCSQLPNTSQTSLIQSGRRTVGLVLTQRRAGIFIQFVPFIEDLIVGAVQDCTELSLMFFLKR